MIRTSAIITQHLGCITPHKDSTGMTNARRHCLRIVHRQFQVFRGNPVGKLYRFIHVAYLYERALPFQGGTDDVGTRHLRQ